MGKIKAWIFRNDPNRCVNCGKKLSLSEKHYLENTCNKCESKMFCKLYEKG